MCVLGDPAPTAPVLVLVDELPVPELLAPGLPVPVDVDVLDEPLSDDPAGALPPFAPPCGAASPADAVKQTRAEASKRGRIFRIGLPF